MSDVPKRSWRPWSSLKRSRSASLDGTPSDHEQSRDRIPPPPPAPSRETMASLARLPPTRETSPTRQPPTRRRGVIRWSYPGIRTPVARSREGEMKNGPELPQTAFTFRATLPLRTQFPLQQQQQQQQQRWRWTMLEPVQEEEVSPEVKGEMELKELDEYNTYHEELQRFSLKNTTNNNNNLIALETSSIRAMKSFTAVKEDPAATTTTRMDSVQHTVPQQDQQDTLLLHAVASLKLENAASPTTPARMRPVGNHGPSEIEARREVVMQEAGEEEVKSYDDAETMEEFHDAFEHQC